MKYHASIRFDVDTDTPDDAARAFVRLLHTQPALDVAVTGPPRTGTVFLRVTNDRAREVQQP